MMVGGNLRGAAKMASLCSAKPSLLSAAEIGPLGAVRHCGNITGPFALPVQECPTCTLVPRGVTVPLLQPCHLLWPRSRNPLCGAAHHLCRRVAGLTSRSFFTCRRYFPWNLILLSIFVSSTSGQHLPHLREQRGLRAGETPALDSCRKEESHPLIAPRSGLGAATV